MMVTILMEQVCLFFIQSINHVNELTQQCVSTLIWHDTITLYISIYKVKLINAIVFKYLLKNSHIVSIEKKIIEIYWMIRKQL